MEVERQWEQRIAELLEFVTIGDGQIVNGEVVGYGGNVVNDGNGEAVRYGVNGEIVRYTGDD
jgi:hypothetical protein